MRRRAALFTLLAPAAALTGCASRREMALDPSLFPAAPAAPEGRAQGGVAIVLQPAVRDLVHEGEDVPARQLRMPVGLIVGQAMLKVADAAFAGGAQLVEAPAADGTRHAATLVVQSACVAYHSRLLWLIPIPVLGVVFDREYDAWLALDITLLDARGQAVWTHTYDDGRQIWPHDWTEQGRAPEALQRLTHEAAWRLARQAVHDVRDWALAERLRAREL